MLLTDLFRFNPLNLLLPQKVVPKSNYKVTLLLKNIRTVIRTEIIDQEPDLETLEITSANGEIILTGVYLMGWLWVARFLGVEAIHYRVRLKPVLVKDNKAHCKIIGYRVWDTKPRRFDFVRWFGKVEPFHKKKVLDSILKSSPHLLSLTSLQWEIRINLRYFLELVPSIAGNIEIQYLVADNSEIYFFVRSGTILKPLVDFFGPEYVKIDYIEEDRDVPLLLWGKS
ncbi:hypothetical protein [Leptospira ilyithenensis]|uniref:Uncharacterized protein n=1 Tax=Leptospira ilyithenensis TaxID=2484901 RepID=A0A4R9LPI3_9LEPT|nr:hypothetical protein [Leptospira ilyithenensis]TGN09729.1 hypothetical protein EHS11_11630 [Leptospira ilyithenensis]